MKRYIIYILLLLCLKGYSQIPKGEWREHLPYTNIHSIVITDDKIYCAADKSIFIYDKEDYSIQKLSKLNGLSDLDIGSIAYSKIHKSLIVGYNNGNIDVVKDGITYNLSYVKDKNIVANKNINNINIVDNTALISSGLGIIVIDIKKVEFVDLYTVSLTGDYTNVNKTIVVNDSIIALTNNGIFKGDVNNRFLSFYKNWNKDTTIQYHDNKFTNGTILNNKLIVSNTIPDTSECILQEYHNNKWRILTDTLHNIKSLSNAENELAVISGNNTYIFNSSYQLLYKYYSPHATCTMSDKDGYLYIGNELEGLMVKQQNQHVKTILPQSANSSKVFRIQSNGNEILVAQGERDIEGTPFNYNSDFFIFKDNTWQIIADNKLDTITDIVCFATQKGNPSLYYAGSCTSGLIELKDNIVTNIYNSKNTDGVLQNHITDCTFDDKGNLWIVCSNAENPIVVKTPDNKWYSYHYNGLWSNKSTNKIFCTSWGDLWTISQVGVGNNFFIWNDNNTPENENDDEFHVFDLRNTTGILDNTLNDIGEDHNGLIWIATSAGVVVIDYPDKALSQPNRTYARRPIMEYNGLAIELLETENVTALAIDGANRKWFGTNGSGLFLISADGTEQLAHYNIKNSKLISDFITDLEFNQTTGELFIGTTEGLVSFMTNSTEPKEDFNNIYAFPNPVEGDYDGIITIRGLMYESDVKITDIAGNLVHETHSYGGDAVWNGKDLQGNAVKSGVYTVFCVTADGEQKGTTKILIVR